MRKRNKQYGSGASDYVNSYYAWGVDPAQLTNATLSNINNSPMFNPLQSNTISPTGTSGIIPTGAYYNSFTPININNPIGPPTQSGGKPVLYITKNGKEITNPWIAHVYQFAENNNMTYANALKDTRVKQTYSSYT